MTHNYCIIESNIPQYKAMIVGLSAESITDYFDEISKFLSLEKLNGKILLDYYSYNHSKKRRFSEIDFDGNCFPIKTIRRVTIEKNTKKRLNILYKMNGIPEALFLN